MKKILILHRPIMSLANACEAWLGDDDLSLVSRGPPSGAVVVTAGAAKLFGIQFAD